MTPCILATSPQTICHHTTGFALSLGTIQPITSYLQSISTTCTMDTDAPPSEAMVPAGADSHLKQSSLISPTAFADVDALTISPAAAAGSAAAIVSKVRLSILVSHHRI
jgi:hypothetical protein